jgi:WD40 repeat protein
MMHPTTYINKLVFAGGNRLELWNIIEDAKIYDFKTIQEKKQGAQVTIVVQSPVIHTVAIGYSDGDIALCNLQSDEVLFNFHETEGAIRSLSFSTDTTMGHSLLASVSGDGASITLWDLNKQKIYSII